MQSINSSQQTSRQHCHRAPLWRMCLKKSKSCCPTAWTSLCQEAPTQPYAAQHPLKPLHASPTEAAASMPLVTTPSCTPATGLGAQLRLVHWSRGESWLGMAASSCGHWVGSPAWDRARGCLQGPCLGRLGPWASVLSCLTSKAR